MTILSYNKGLVVNEVECTGGKKVEMLSRLQDMKI